MVDRVWRGGEPKWFLFLFKYFFFQVYSRSTHGIIHPCVGISVVRTRPDDNTIGGKFENKNSNQLYYHT